MVYCDYGQDPVLEYGPRAVAANQDVTLFHVHPQYEVFLCFEKVKCSTIINGRVLVTEHPLAIVAAPNSMHLTYFLENLEPDQKTVNGYTLYFDESFLRRFGDELLPIRSILGDSHATIIDLSECTDHLSAIVREMVRFTGRPKATVHIDLKQQLLSAAIVNLLEEYVRQGTPATRVSQKNYISEVMLYLVKNLDKNLLIPEVAEEFFVSRDKLCRDFRKYIKMNVGDFISAARINLAKNYLRDTKMTIKQIAQKCGFDNDIYFYSFFKKHVGMTPKEFAKNVPDTRDETEKIWRSGL